MISFRPWNVARKISRCSEDDAEGIDLFGRKTPLAAGAGGALR
jgi:hypothetical protein